jgi:hypothetical protein
MCASMRSLRLHLYLGSMQVTAFQKILAFVIAAVYIVTAVVFVGLAYWWFNPSSEEQYKNFGVFAGMILATDAAFCGLLSSFLSLNAQARSAKDLAKQNAKTQKDLEDYKGEIQKGLENYKKDIVEGIEALKGQIARQNEFVSKTLDAKSAAYNKLFVATTNCYRELQNLAKGEYDKKKVEAAERSLREAEALAANLDDADRQTVEKIVQAVMNLRDTADALTSTGDALAKDRQALWNSRAPEFGKQMEALRDRSPFYNQEIQ